MAEKKSSGSKKKSGKGNAKKKSDGRLYDASKDELLRYYREMMLIRRFEEKAGQMYGQGLIGGFCHLYIGQEAVVIGIQDTLEDGDQVVTAYRCHGHMLACGMDPKGVMAELTGREGGYSKGKGGSMHMFSVDKNFLGGHGIVGAPAPIGTGVALAQVYQDTGKISVTYFGEGAANQGQVAEAFNMAKLWNLPVLFIIENNQYAMGTSAERSTGNTDFSKRGESYGIPGRSVDGMNILEVRKAAEKAVQEVRGGKGPLILEMKTYRYRGHSMSDPAKYRSKDEVSEVKEKRDPIKQLKSHILDTGVADEDALKEIDKAVKEQINEAADFAKESPEPGESELWTDVLVEA